MTNYYVRSRPSNNRAASTAYSLGQRVVSTSSTQFLGIHFECTTAGTTAGGGEPAWSTTIGGTTGDGGVTWTTRGSATVWVASKTYVAGDRVIATGNASGQAQQRVYECTTGGTAAGTEPAWNTTNGGTKVDGGVTWTTRDCSSGWNDSHPHLYMLMNGQAGISAGCTVYMASWSVDNNIAGNYNDMTIVGPSATTSAAVISCTDTGDPVPPTVSTYGAQLVVANNQNLILKQALYMYGVHFVLGSSTNTSPFMLPGNSSTGGRIYLDNCLIDCVGTNYQTAPQIGNQSGGNSDVTFNNTAVKFSNVQQQINLYTGRFTWKNTASALQGSAQDATHPLFTAWPNTFASVELKNLDFSNLTNYLAALSTNSSYSMTVNNVRVGSGCALNYQVSSYAAAPEISGVNFGSTSANYAFKYAGLGVVSSHETTIVRTGGATDGTTQTSWKTVTDGVPTLVMPATIPKLMAYNTTTGSSVTATVEFVHDSATALKNNEIWMETEYLGDASYPDGSMATCRVADLLGTAAAQAASSATWTTTGMSNPNKQKLAVTFTPQMKGWVTCKIYIAKASYTVYIDPMVTVA